MESAKIQKTIIAIQEGDVSNLVVDAIVSPDSSDFFMSKGPARAIAKASDVRVRQEIQLDKPLQIGDVVLSSAGKLPSKHILHVAIMEPDARELDRNKITIAIRNVLRRADDSRFKTLGIPVFGSSLAAFPYDTCAKIMLNSIFDYFLNRESNIEMVIVAVFDKDALDPFRKVFASVRQIYQV
jgi:O-acetyl-ADP-ribose deacetylase